MNWYKLAKIDLRMRRQAGWKEGILATLLSLMSGIAAPYEAQAIKKHLDKKHVDPKQQQEIVSTINHLTHQNKNVNDLSMDDIGFALEVIGRGDRIKPDKNKRFDQQSFDRIFDRPDQPQSKHGEPSISAQHGGELNLEELKETIRRHEGKSNKIYLDPSGKNWNIGYGFNLNKANSPSVIRSIGGNYKSIINKKQSLSDDQVEILLDISIEEAISAAKRFTPNYEDLPSKAKLVLVNMAFMGRGNIGSFDRLKSALAWNDYDKAADEMLKSLWARQVGSRAVELANIMRSVAIM